MKSGLLRDLRPVLRLFWQHQRRAMLQGAALAALTALAGAALLGLSGWFLTAAALAGLSFAAKAAFDVFMPSATIRLLALGRTAARYGERLVTHDATLRVLASLRAQLFDSWSRPGAAGRLLMRPARLLFRLTHDIDALDSLYLRILVPAMAALSVAIGAGLLLGWMNLGLGLGVIAVLLVAGITLPLIAAQRAARATLRRAQMLETCRAQTVDLVQGQKDLLMVGQLQAQADAILATDRRLAKTDTALNRIELRTGLGFGLVGAAVLSGVLLVSGLLVQQGLLSAPGAALSVLLAFAAIEPFAALRRGAMELPRMRLAARRLNAQLAPPPKTVPLAAPAGALAVHLDGVSVSGKSDQRLADLALDIAQGETVALIGHSGAGKSSLLALLMQEITPDHGIVQALPAALMTQSNQIFAQSLRDNLRLAAPEADDAVLLAALARAGLENALPDGLDTRLGEGGLGLSGGQARRLALARMILRDAPLWLLDEPTEGLDSAVARDVITQLAALTAQRTIVIATHIRREAEIADRLIVMQRGRITARHDRASPGFNAALALLRPD
ncbi:amino acid ABC transporter ATP-binding/permease protein [Ketogulonicigenium vulgare]|uniref:ABC transporter, ATP-binding/permease protein n=1 Tax=Ketogulonicigenium vulgare (strain WSH-001) TaxID=759362 RepID=F9Y886_KETVW|nr:ATP-binding cassette domain-containing protein [Ketogulonicigenium vulgare]ADO41522.1 cysteine ABC transporter permease/ATP-binding protein [Ketogulonicigenium vulgare Y25]AEM42372.1 ABC transporter, ATP-binding/permease protein [Ketogulonicigenium vulgare WSH-001]ALJ79996.1 ABC transporter ATP-binding protein [Ketogulonicigenium vulgare]ANW32884.1 ABC transporter ATP-binding protein [Ketogulonicigenium vulgare]AOZ53456.1 cysteine ABC transporter permease/ATP-binding protein [Ketogulonicige